MPGWGGGLGEREGIGGMVEEGYRVKYIQELRYMYYVSPGSILETTSCNYLSFQISWE